MEQKKAILYLTKLHCLQETHENGSDSMYMHIYCDGVFYDRFPSSDVWHMHTDDIDQVDIEIECTYYNEIRIELYERDSSSDKPDGKDERFYHMYIKRGDSLDINNEGSRTTTQSNGTGPGEYKIDFRVITNPIPTVRVHGIRCETRSAGMNTDLIADVAGVASECAEVSGEILKKSPRPSRKLIGDAFIAVSKVLQGLEAVATFIGGVIEGKDDDVYMKHVAETSSRAYDGGFFPVDEDTFSMHEGDDEYFDEYLEDKPDSNGKNRDYFRFPLDQGKVTIEFKEYDLAKADIIIGSIVIDPDQIAENSTNGIDGGSPPSDSEDPPIEGGTAIMDGGAVVEIANSYYGRRDGEGAIYHICYSVGMEDWCLAATDEAQGTGA
ncbi:MAG: hypothetical protein JKY03_06935 [Aureispira sp.]|nr:hypothetical protein [Aureispira sp.]